MLNFPRHSAHPTPPTQVPLPYETSLKLTIARYFTPSGRCIQAVDYKQQAAVAGGGGGKATGSAALEDLLLNDGLDPDESRPQRRKVLEEDRRTYKTLRKGRLVRDGGGIEPGAGAPGRLCIAIFRIEACRIRL